MSDISAVIIWWLTILALGTITLPITLYFFRNFIDRGYIFSKVITIILSSFIMWYLASLHLLTFSKLNIVLILIALTIVNMFLFTRLKLSGLKLNYKWIILEEIMFLATLAFWSYVRAHEPSIRGLEKFMDYGFVNSIMRANYFPPADMWLTRASDFSGGYFINYYYFGHYINAFLSKIAGIDTAITYNLMIATLYAFTFCLTFCLGANLFYFFLKARQIAEKGVNLSKDKPQLILPLSGQLKILLVGMGAAFLVSMGGNLHTFYAFTGGYPNEKPEPPWNVELSPHPEKYWYPNATRFIPFTIHEFPIYSFVVADLHGHVSDIPMVLLVLALLLSLLTSRQHHSDLSHLSNLRRLLAEFENHTSVPFLYILFIGLLLGVMYMTNAWDGLIYMILTGCVFLYLNLIRGGGAPPPGAGPTSLVFSL